MRIARFFSSKAKIDFATTATTIFRWETYRSWLDNATYGDAKLSESVLPTHGGEHV